MNALASASSAYLRSAAHQPVQWQAWGEEAFALAQREDKPILLDIGAVWCHWCHVMDRESYENPAIATFLNEHYIPVKVDRDERPDVDSRYQAAVSAISGQGGWPLTVFLTPKGEPFFGGTYFPPEDRYGRPGFGRVLATMSDVFHGKKEEMQESARSVMEAIAYNEGYAGRSGDLTPSLLQKLVQHPVGQFDPRHGGFGSQPKFPHPAALDLLLDAVGRSGDPNARKVVEFTLSKMAAGGIFDHLAGGFHRYSVDDHWLVPHFEKMSYDNSELLRNYVHAFATLADPIFAATAREILRFMDTVLSDREHGGFYASQDADISLDDDGDYFTWTLAEVSEVLTTEELKLVTAYYDIGVLGDMHHDPARNVLNVKHTLEEAASLAKIPLDQAKAVLTSANARLYERRLARTTPYIDKTIYVNWNGMAISAYLEADRTLSLPEAKRFALMSLDRILAQAWHGERGLDHVVAYAESSTAAAVPGMLDDYVFLLQACLDAWESTAKLGYYRHAEAIAEQLIARFYDTTTPSFYDAEPQPGALGALAIRRKPLQDAPTPAGNPAAASALLRLSALSEKSRYGEIAQDTLESFAGVVEHFGLYAGAYGLALARLLHGALQVVIVGDDEAADHLALAASSPWLVNKSIVRLRWEQCSSQMLPPALAATVPKLPQGRSVAMVCTHESCLTPVSTPEAIVEQLAGLLNAATRAS
jgi:uncharacterized protein YyaL (SSP411 family)